MGVTSSHRVSLSGVVSKDALDSYLRAVCQDEWCTNVRLHGLLMLIDYVHRNHNSQGTPVPADLAHGYISN